MAQLAAAAQLVAPLERVLAQTADAAWFMLSRMNEPTICRCPQAKLREGLELALASAAPEQRGPLVDSLRPLALKGTDVFAGLAVALQQDGDVLGAAWLQPQVGRTGTLWPPGVVDDSHHGLQQALAAGALQAGCDLPIDLTQALLETVDDPFAADLLALGFTQLAELKYLMHSIPSRVEAAEESPLELVAPATSNKALLKRLLMGTYQGTLDCPALSGRREFDDIIEGYQAVGEFDESLWFVVNWNGQPAGLLLLAQFPESHQWELVYMGVLHEYRGRGIGDEVLRELRGRAARANIEHVVLAVDSNNTPAIKMYDRAGYVEWARRVAFVKG